PAAWTHRIHQVTHFAALVALADAINRYHGLLRIFFVLLSQRARQVAEPALTHTVISINATIAQKRPVAANILQLFQIAARQEHGFLIMPGPCQQASLWIADEGSAPEIETPIGRALMTDAIDRGDVDAVGHGMSALADFPGLVLGSAVLCSFARVPA